VRRINKKTLLIVAVLFLAACSVLAAGMFYVLNKSRRQRVLMESADRHMVEKDYPRAILQYQRAVSLGNATGEMYFKYGRCLEELQQPRQAFYAFERAAALDDSHAASRKRIVETYYVRAVAALARADADPAKIKPLKRLEDCARALLRMRPSEREGYVWLARAEFLKGETDQALQTIEKGRESVPGDAEIISEKVRLLLQAERMAEAEKEIAGALSSLPDSPELLLTFAGLCAREGRAEEEERALNRILELNPENAIARRQLGSLFWRQERREDAIRELEKVCELLPETAAHWIALARFCATAGQADKALQVLEKGRALNPKDLALLVALTRLQIDRRLLVEARASIEMLRKMKAGPPGIAWLEGRVEFAAGRLTVAKSKFLEATRKSKAEYADAHYGLGLCYRREGNYDAAEEQFVLAAHSPGLRRNAWLALAELYLLEGRPEDALARCAEIENLRSGLPAGPKGKRPQDLKLLTLIGRVHIQQMKLGEAESALGAALEVARTPAQKAELLGLLARLSLARHVLASREGDKAQADGHLTAAGEQIAEAEKLDPDNLTVGMIHAQLAHLMGDTEKAWELIKRTTISPEGAARFIKERLMRGVVFARGEEAVRLVDDLAAAHPDSPEVLGAAAEYFGAAARAANYRARRLAGDSRDAQLRIGEGSAAKAVSYARKAYEIERTNVSHVARLFDLLLMNERLEEAQGLAEALTGSSATKPLGLAFEGLVLHGRGQREDGIEKLKQSLVLDEKNWRTHFWLGQIHARTKDRAAEAERELGRALELNPRAMGAAYSLFGVLEAQGKFERVQAEIDRVLERFPNNIACLTRSARLFEKTGEMEKAAARWKRVTVVAPGAPRWRTEHSRILRRLGLASDAVAEARKAVELSNQSIESLRALISAHLANRDRAAAEQVLRQALESKPDDPRLYILASALHRALGQSAEAEAELKKLVAARKADAFPHFLLGTFYTSQQRYVAARKEYADALRIQPGFAAAEFALVNVLLTQARSSSVGAEVEELLAEVEQRVAAIRKSTPESLRAALVETDLLAARGKLDKAEELLRALVQEHRDMTLLRLNLARLYLQREKFDESKEELEAALAIDERQVAAHMLLARVHLNQNRLRDALDNARNALRYAPTGVAALGLSAQIKQRIGKGSEAIADLQKIVKLRPADRSALLRLVQALLALKRERDALLAVKDAYARNPSSAPFLEEYVRLLRHLKRPEEAETVCKTFLAANPDSEAAQLMLAGAQFQAGKDAEAEQSLQAAEKAARNLPAFLRRAVNVCLQTERHERAVALAERLAAALPQAPLAHGVLVAALRQAGRKEAAAEAALDSLRRNVDSPVFLRQAAATLIGLGKAETAVAECEAFLERHPEDLGIRLMTANLWIRAKKTGKALAHIEKIETLAGANPPPNLGANLARMYASLGRYAAAERVALGICKRVPDSAQAWLNYTSILELQGPTGRQRAVPLYRKVLSGPLRGHKAKMILINNLAYALTCIPHKDDREKQGALAEAEAWVESILGDREIAPTFLLDTLAWIKFLGNKSAEAHDLLALATSRRDASAEVWYHYAMACARTDRAETALDAVQNAVKLDPEKTSWLVDVKAEIAQNQAEE